MLSRRRLRAKTSVPTPLPKSENKMEVDLETTSSAESDAAESHAIEEKDLLFNKIFGNDLIWDKIAGYLGPADLKVASASNRLLFHKIRNQRFFTDKVKLIICRETYQKKILSKTRLKWKHCDIELSTLPPKALPAIRRVLQFMESVELYEAYGTSEKDRNHFIKEIIPNAPNLRSLTLDCSIIERLSTSLLLEPDIKSSLSNLEELRIVTGRSDENRMVSCSDGSKSTFPMNIFKLSEIPMIRLKSFEFQKVDTYYGSQKEHVTYIPQLIQNSRLTMQNLKLQLHMWSLEAMKSLACPSLRSLYITAYRRNDAIVKAFLEKQPLLEKLCVQFKNGFPISVLKTIAERGSKLEQLHLKTSSFTDSPDLIDWSFLLNITCLKDFKMFQPRAYIGPNETQGTVSQFLNALPDGIKKICLRGLEHGWAGDLTANTVTCLQRFTNLTELSLMRCEEVINDDIFQFICSRHKQLRVLQFSHTQSLTDYGITGKRVVDGVDEDTGISLKDLRGLQKLTMRDCRHISDAALLATVKFQELTRLDLAIRSEALSNATLTQLVRQNPSLEHASVHVTTYPNEISEKELKRVNPRFKRIHSVQDDWNVEDSDSDAEEFDEEFDESSENGSFDSWDWESDFDDEDDIIIAWGPGGDYSDMSDPDDFD